MIAFIRFSLFRAQVYFEVCIFYIDYITIESQRALAAIQMYFA